MKLFFNKVLIIIILLSKINNIYSQTIKYKNTSLYDDSCYNFIKPYYDSINIRQYIHIESSVDIDSLRKQLIRRIWKRENLPLTIPDTIISSIDSIFFINNIEYPNLKSIDEYKISMDLGFNSHIYRLGAKLSRNKLMIIHQGHSDPSDNGIKEAIGFFIRNGYDILYCNMPLMNGNIGPISLTSVEGHNQMGLLEDSLLNPLKFFLEPIAISLNYIDSTSNYDEISILGVSGGGWTTTVYAALDTRINYSFPVAGTLPDYLRVGPCSNNSGGDWEQSVIENQGSLSYLDLYILGAHGAGRKQIQILNKYDACCFFGINYMTYDTIVSNSVNKLQNGYFEVYLDTTHFEHKISYTALNYILDKIPSKCQNDSLTLYSPFDDITEGFINKSGIITATNKIIGESKVFLQSPNSIVLQPGFEVVSQLNSTFEAEIKTCENLDKKKPLKE